MSIYSLGGRRGTWASALHCAQTGEAGRPGVRPDVRAGGPDVRAGGVGLDAFGMEDVGFPGIGRISGLG